MTHELSEVVWKSCPGAPSYEISSHGQVIRVAGGPGARVGNILKPSEVCGYWQVVVMVNCQRKTIRLHRLVARAFIGEPPTPKHQVAHADGDRKNNHFKNLRWATPRENSEDRIGHGTMHVRTWNSKLVEADIRRIRALAAEGITQEALAKEYGVQSAHISKVVRRLKWRQHSDPRAF